ncbi:MAG: zinc-binding dehydrogenase [Chloroflexi bacterium]|nr:MAG: zinc-binding dehydrogenase [Chloroflexota bacterium]
MQGRAAITDGLGNFSIEPIEVGEPGADEVLVQVAAAGVCHTDWKSLRWGRRLILGHEGAGLVRQAGALVKHVTEGDRVLLNWAISCGTCFQCALGNHALCERHSPVAGLTPLGGHAHLDGTRWHGEPVERSFNLGTMSTLTLVRGQAVCKIEVDVPFASACIVGCGVMTGFGSVVNAARVKAGTSVVVIGCGGVGLNVIQGARIAGASAIIGVDVKPSRLRMAERFGATHVIEAARDDANLAQAAQRVRALTQGRGADYAFECTAVPALAAAPLAMVRHGGTAVQVSGVEQPLTIDMSLFEWDKVYLNPLYGKCNPTIDFPRIFALYAQGALLLDELVTCTYALEEVGQAFEDMHAGVNAKGVLVMA